MLPSQGAGVAVMQTCTCRQTRPCCPWPHNGARLLHRHACLQVFAPANLRAASQNIAYAQLVNRWIEAQYTLRYTGGMVPDVHHIIAKGHGIFCNPCSLSAPAKLRLLYECAPLALIIEVCGMHYILYGPAVQAAVMKVLVPLNQPCHH